MSNCISEYSYVVIQWYLAQCYFDYFSRRCFQCFVLKMHESDAMF